MIRKALVIGVDNYDRLSALDGCENDATAMSEKLRWNGDGSQNFDVRTITSKGIFHNVKDRISEYGPTRRVLSEEIKNLFSEEADLVVLYFAGHGIFDETADFGFIAAEDGDPDSWGVNLDTILKRANAAYPEIRSTVIILDCCHSGQLGDPGKLEGLPYASIGKGVTVLTASSSTQIALETDDGKHGVFTSMLLNGLDGEAANLEGDVSPAALYELVDRMLGPFEQRPQYKANLHASTSLRRVEVSLSSVSLRQLYKLFTDKSEEFDLDPSCEPLQDRGHMLEETKHIIYSPERAEKYKLLQSFCRASLVEPVNVIHMWDAAVYSKSCRLTKKGRLYWQLAEKGRFGRVD